MAARILLSVGAEVSNREFSSELRPGRSRWKTLLDLNADSSVDWQSLVFTKVNDQDESVYTLIMADVLAQGQDPAKPATIKITASVYVADTTVTTNGQSVSVPAGAIKFSAKISNWPFETQDNTLLLEMTASGKSATVGDAPGQDISILSIDPAVNGAETQVVKFSHGFFMDASLVVNIDGKKDTVQVSIDQAKSTIGWKFPSFATFADYDPVLRFVAPRPHHI
ncbi:hypothetical protein Poli38472_010959 [Pythium oligandrum]|uniref:Uncharacterized protein n=1 Tax=Pythium oligandrum TaxID=41045 RepID=A0A8K1CEE0_PYTOL|nr:hypothetical protein Poli38472_010959 [Pythium oligandrum]|eukprot:TMW61896.1 hypothetical protein Poli38472_010959 [Pythium oligandrum]